MAPIFKSGDHYNVENYRPISLLCILSKVFESIIYSKVISFIRSSHCCEQFGFLANRSSVSQLPLSFSKILENCDKGLSTDLVYFDFRKAFDSVPHSILLYKLWSIGVTGTLWHWFQCYMSNRHHFVLLEDQPSALLNVKSGVPQGSILGLLLFLIFVNDLPSCISHSSLLLFADDSKVQNTISSSHDALHLQSDIDSWTYINSLFLNPNKCAAIRFSLSHSDGLM